MEVANALGIVTIQQQQAAVPPPPPPHRRARLRVREVSSRFMSPLVASNAITTPTPTPAAESQRSKSVQRWPQQHELEPSSISRADDENVPETARSLDSSTPLAVAALGGSHHHSTKAAALVSSSHRKQQQQQVKFFKENDAGGALAKTELQQPRSSVFFGSGRTSSSSRSDTPIVAGADRDRIIPSRYRLASQCLHRPTATSINGGGVSVSTAAAKLLQEATSTDPLISSSDSCTTCAAPSSTVCFQVNNNSNRTRTLSDLRSSIPEVDVLPTLSTRWPVARSFNNFPVGEINNDLDSYKATTSPCSRSLNLPHLNTENPSSSSSSSSFWLCLRAGDTRAASTPSKTSIKNQLGSLCLPPHPSSLKLGAADAKKGRKLFNHQEDVHSLKLLYNRHLQWRFANAKSEVSMLTQKMETEVCDRSVLPSLY